MSLKPSHAMLALVACCLGLLAARGWLFPEQLDVPRPLVPLRRPAELTIYYHERRPYYYREGERVTGTVVERAASALRRAGIAHRWEAMPPAQQLQTMREGRELAAGIGWIANDERRQFARFSAPFWQDGELVALTRADEPRLQTGMQLAEVLADHELILLVKDAYSYGPEVDALLARLRPRTASTPAPNDAMLRMLAERRADYFLLAHEEAEALLAGSPEQAAFTHVELRGAPRGVTRHLMFSRRVPEELVRRFDDALRQLAHPVASGLP